MRIVARSLVAGLCAAIFVLSAHVSGRTVRSVAINRSIQDASETLYNTFRKGMTGGIKARKAAYDAGKEFLQRYADDKDPRTSQIQDWTALYEADLRGLEVLDNVFKEKKYAEAFQLAKQVLLTDPDNIRILIALGYAGMPANAAGNELTSDSIMYGTKAIQLIESGKAPMDWSPFSGRDETLAWLNYSLGVMIFRTNPNDAVVRLGKAAMYEGAPKRDPRVYYYLAFLYGQNFEKLQSEYKTKYEGKPETPDSKAAREKANAVIDLIIDAYARAITYTNANPQLKEMFQQQEFDWMSKLRELFKSRHDGSDAGLREFIADIKTKPLPGHQSSPAPLTLP